MHQNPIISLAFSAFLAVQFPAFAADTTGVMTAGQLRAAGFTQLAAADSLDDFDVKPWHQNHWTIKDGVISYDGKAENKAFQKNSLWTKKDYGDLQMYAEWRLPEKPTTKPHPIVLFNGDFLLDDNGKRITRPHLDAGDSGLMFRGTSNCQANIWSQELGSGEINGYRTNHKLPQSVRRACIPIKNADRPLGEWNTFLITVKGNRMSVDTNGERVINEAVLPDLPKTGPIGLQHHGDPVQFRQLWVKELSLTSMPTLTPKAPFEWSREEKKQFLDKIKALRTGDKIDDVVKLLGPPYSSEQSAGKKIDDIRGPWVSYYLKKQDNLLSNEKNDQALDLEFNSDNRLVSIHTNIKGLRFGSLTGINSEGAVLENLGDPIESAQKNNGWHGHFPAKEFSNRNRTNGKCSCAQHKRLMGTH
jgi:hypothetical protein